MGPAEGHGEHYRLDDAATLLRDADAAMYRAKSAGPGRVELFDEALRGTVLSRLELEIGRTIRCSVRAPPCQ